MSLNIKLGIVAAMTVFIGGLLLLFLTEFQLFVINRVAAFQGYRLHKSIAYGESPEQQLDVYLPQEKNNELLPVVVFFYGGCWGACSTHKKHQYGFVAEAFSSHKIIAVVADYRLYPAVKFPEIIVDASQAVEWVYNHIGDYGGDPQRIFLMGHSSGAHMASMLAVNPNYLSQATYSSIKGFIGLAGPYNFLPFGEDYMPILFGAPMRPMDSQPVYFVDGKEPPALLMYGTADTLVKPVNIEGMTNAIQAAGGVVEKHIYQDVSHSQILGAYSVLFRNRKPMFSDTLNFIRKYSDVDQNHAVTSSAVDAKTQDQ